MGVDRNMRSQIAFHINVLSILKANSFGVDDVRSLNCFLGGAFRILAIAFHNRLMCSGIEIRGDFIDEGTRCFSTYIFWQLT